MELRTEGLVQMISPFELGDVFWFHGNNFRSVQYVVASHHFKTSLVVTTKEMT